MEFRLPGLGREKAGRYLQERGRPAQGSERGGTTRENRPLFMRRVWVTPERKASVRSRLTAKGSSTVSKME